MDAGGFSDRVDRAARRGQQHQGGLADPRGPVIGRRAAVDVSGICRSDDRRRSCMNVRGLQSSPRRMASTGGSEWAIYVLISDCHMTNRTDPPVERCPYATRSTNRATA